MDISVVGINRSLDLIDSVFMHNEDHVILSPLPFEFHLPNPIVEVIPEFSYQIPESETITNLDYVSYDDIMLTPPPLALPLTVESELPSTVESSLLSTAPPASWPEQPVESVESWTEPSTISEPSSLTDISSLSAVSMLPPAIPGTSSGRVFNEPPPQRNFFCDSDNSDVQMDHFGRPIRTRSQTSSVGSSVQNSTGICSRPPTHKVQCEVCHKFYTKSYIKRHLLVHDK